MSRVGWKFYDPVTLEEITLEINPKEADSPVMSKNISYQSPAAPGAGVIAQEGRQKPKTMTFTGTTLTEDQYNVWVEWFNKPYQIKLTDDLLRDFWIYITDFQPKRVRSIKYPWRHEYTVNCFVVEWP